MKRIILKSLLLSVLCGFWAFPTTAAVSLFSDYGQIQNVQNYSSNPFWSPNAPYNQRLPQPVFATGADLNAGDCQRVVQSLVSAQCMARDNCKNSDVSDIRPIVMVQLSNLPGHNYVSACGGYIDSAVESYKRQYGNALPNRKTDFPSPTTPNLNTDDSNGIQFENPYKIQPTKWQLEQKERSDELQSLQRQNGYGSNNLAKTNFPATYADLSFSERIENDRTGLEPFKDLKAYKTLNVKTTEEWCTDGEHANSAECWEWRCGTNGKDAKKTECVTYRCSKPDYYNANTDECKRNELCVPNNNSMECMRYRCYETDDARLAECIEWKCKNDASFNAEHQDECTEENGGGSDGGSGSTSNDNAGIIINNNGAGNINDDNGELQSEGLCLVNHKFDLKSTASTVFESIQVHTPEVAHKLAQEYVKCSSEPNFTVASEYTKSGNDDFFNVNKPDGTTAYKIKFDDVTENNGNQYGMDTIKALCLIANSTPSKRNCHNSACQQDCIGITEKQFAEISKLTQELLVPTGEKFQGWGKWCYRLIFIKKNKQLNFLTRQGDCVSEILSE